MKCLIIKQPWIEYILNGSKSWEIRGSKTNMRGKIGLIESGTGLIVGSCEILGCRQISLKEYQNNKYKHKIEMTNKLPYANTYAWFLSKPERYNNPIHYNHPRGAIIWVNVNQQCNNEVMMDNKKIKSESIERKIRRHEVSFSAIQGNQSQDYLDGYLNKHSSQGSVDIVDQMVDKIDKKILRDSLSKLQGQDKLILCQYLAGTKQNVIADRFGISPSAINQRLEKIIYNYRAILCNNEEFTQSSFWDKFQREAEYLFNAYLQEIRQKGILTIDLNEVKNLIKETRKAITHSITTKSNMNIREQLSKQIDYSSLDDKYVEQMNNAFAEQGIEAHFEKLKTFKGNIVQVLKMVDDFITDLEEKSGQIATK